LKHNTCFYQFKYICFVLTKKGKGYFGFLNSSACPKVIKVAPFNRGIAHAVVIMMIEVKPKRPDGITVIVILWFLSGIFNVYMSFQIISTDVSYLPLLSDPTLHSWFSFGLPAEIAINLLSLFLGLLQIVTVFGLWTGKKYSYRFSETMGL